MRRLLCFGIHLLISERSDFSFSYNQSIIFIGKIKSKNRDFIFCHFTFKGDNNYADDLDNNFRLIVLKLKFLPTSAACALHLRQFHRANDGSPVLRKTTCSYISLSGAQKDRM